MTDDGKDVEKGNPPTLLVGMQASAATLENSMEVPQKVENRATLRPSNCTIGYIDVLNGEIVLVSDGL